MNTNLAVQLNWRRLKALCRKETLQIIRDPSSNIIAFILPIIMLLIFGFGINLDSSAIRLGIVLEDRSPEAMRFRDSFLGSPYFEVVTAERAILEEALSAGQIQGFVVVQPDFDARLNRQFESAPVLVVTDGSEPNTANFMEHYVRGAWGNWLRHRSMLNGEASPSFIQLEPRFWFNPSAQSRNYLIPGSITIIMTIIGALLTSLVVAREWERGTMEALLASPVTRAELLLSKLLPYYLLGMGSLLICVGTSTFVLKVPFRGSLVALLLISSVFLFSALGMGLLISSVTKNQFHAAETALNLAFLPAMMLSGFVYEIQSMPSVIQGITYLFPARYFVNAMQTLFQAGDLWGVLLADLSFLAVAALLLLFLTAMKTQRRLE